MSETENVDARPPGANSKGPVWIIGLVLGLAAFALIGWYVTQRETPSIVVQRFCSALKGDRWEQAYALIDWPEDRKVDEKSFVSTAKALRPFFTIQKYKLGEPKRDGDVATVPVSVTISKTGLTGTQEVTSDVPVECRFKNGEWKVRPMLKDLLGIGQFNLPGQK